MTKRARAPWATLALAAALGAAAAGCDDEGDKPEQAGPTEQAAKQEPEEVHGLTPEQGEKVLAKVGDTTITVKDFADRLAAQSPYLRARYNSAERRKEFLDNMVRFELLAIEARKRGLQDEPDVQRVERQMMVQQMMKELFDDKGVQLSDISDADIKAYYDEHIDEFKKPAQRRASQIVVPTEAEAKKLLAQLQKADGDMKLFRQLAKEHNIDPETKGRFGDLRFFSKTAPEGETGGPPQAVRDAVFALEKTGAMHPGVIETDAGYHVVKLTGQRAALDRSLEDARRLIQNRLWRKRREAAIEEFVGGLRERSNVQENLALLDEVKVDLTAPGPQQTQAEALGEADEGEETRAEPQAEPEAKVEAKPKQETEAEAQAAPGAKQATDKAGTAE
ncbi:MAG: peptidylprolyl isomerase [Myxococcales bacterium]